MNAEINKKVVSIGEETTVTLTVYGDDNLINTDFNGLYNIELSGYRVLPEGSSGKLGSVDLSTTGITSVDVEFRDGVATIPLVLLSNGSQILTFRLNETNVGGIVQVDVLHDLDQPSGEETEGQPAEEPPTEEPPTEEPPTEEPPTEEPPTEEP
ncbi:hypothetical protein, partial [Paenibacillus macerans]|uniref:hypothetical protein n=1 Tax=Paenibacillus macerans TaxID=44252 RepID=UPI003D31E8DC